MPYNFDTVLCGFDTTFWYHQTVFDFVSLKGIKILNSQLRNLSGQRINAGNNAVHNILPIKGSL